ncbi:MAG TPA: tetratricopeptide repeat protein [Nitrospirota bacterium]|nr:tetratricopeptide repeat protein [Nitrospirota bacterium]
MKRVCGFAFAAWVAMLCLSAILFIQGCSLPKIIILHDPLSPEEHNNLGRIYESQQQFEQAMEQYHAALEKDRNFVPSLLLLGDLSYRLKKYAEAESAYKKAIKLQPENGDIYNNLCWVYIDQEINMEMATDLVQKAISLTPEHRSYYLDTLGVILLKSGKPVESIAALKQAVDLIPKDAPEYLSEAYAHLAEAYAASGNMTAAHDAEQAAEKYRIAK